MGSWLSGGLIMDCPLEEWKGVVDWVLDSEPYVTACLHEKPEWELMRTMGWARRYEGAELGEVPGWHVHRDPEDDRPSPLMVRRKGGHQQCNSYA